ncbi:MAG: Nif11 family protein [Eggerthellaceae bacterium]|nr:Nif11 family protein [Eggerthellaceae bacterium]
MDFNDLTPEQQEKARTCKTPEDVLALARENGIELTEEQLDAVSGGSWNECGTYTGNKHDRFCRHLR